MHSSTQNDGLIQKISNSRDSLWKTDRDRSLVSAVTGKWRLVMVGIDFVPFVCLHSAFSRAQIDHFLTGYHLKTCDFFRVSFSRTGDGLDVAALKSRFYHGGVQCRSGQSLAALFPIARGRDWPLRPAAKCRVKFGSNRSLSAASVCRSERGDQKSTMR
jgi:hypothetical protein